MTNTISGNLNRHKKVKHGLDESTETMEVDAVKFLSTMSGRARLAHSDFDTDLDTDDCSTPTKSGKKGRKSVPKKLNKKEPDEKSDTCSEHNSDIEIEEMITYSDEERELERLNQLNEVMTEETDSVTTDIVEQSTDDIDDSENTDGAGHLRPSRKRKRKELAEEFTDIVDKREREVVMQSRSRRKKGNRIDNIIEEKFKN